MLKQFDFSEFETLSDEELASTNGGTFSGEGGLDWSSELANLSNDLAKINQAGRYAALTANCDISYVSDAYYTMMQFYPY